MPTRSRPIGVMLRNTRTLTCLDFQWSDRHGKFRHGKFCRSMKDDLQSFGIEKEFAADRRIAVNRLLPKIRLL